jgi:hypothetical protein
LFYPNISTTLQLILTLSVGSFRSLRAPPKDLVVIFDGEDRLNGLATIYIQRHLSFIKDLQPLQISKKWTAVCTAALCLHLTTQTFSLLLESLLLHFSCVTECHVCLLVSLAFICIVPFSHLTVLYHIPLADKYEVTNSQ